jgi:hypothetical protein
MRVTCPSCGRALPADELNVATDVGACRGCNEVFKLSDVVTTDAQDVNVLAPPPGAWFRELPDGFEVGATTRSPTAFFLVPFMVVWSGGSLGGIYGAQIKSGTFSPMMSLFGLPFLLGSVIFWSIALMAVAGTCRITVKGRDAALFQGFGPFGWTRRFAWGDVRTVTETMRSGRDARGGAVLLEGATRIKFTSNMSEERRYFVVQALRSRIQRAAPRPEAPFR